MNVRLDHIGIAVPDLESGSAFWRILGLLESEDELNEDQGVNLRFFATDPAEEPMKIELASYYHPLWGVKGSSAKCGQ